ncbi:hypothetical protein [Arthrobacter sp. OAP107]|uniref:hypothetical protein n=1 Tax=Arthrobacter sp. OAP107 TaxID=3156445 RepID=UPI003393EB05
MMDMVSYDFKGKVAFVTGGSAGMGARRRRRSPRPVPLSRLSISTAGRRSASRVN